MVVGFGVWNAWSGFHSMASSEERVRKLSRFPGRAEVLFPLCGTASLFMRLCEGVESGRGTKMSTKCLHGGQILHVSSGISQSGAFRPKKGGVSLGKPHCACNSCCARLLSGGVRLLLAVAGLELEGVAFLLAIVPIHSTAGQGKSARIGSCSGVARL